MGEETNITNGVPDVLPAFEAGQSGGAVGAGGEMTAGVALGLVASSKTDGDATDFEHSASEDAPDEAFGSLDSDKSPEQPELSDEDLVDQIADALAKPEQPKEPPPTPNEDEGEDEEQEVAEGEAEVAADAEPATGSPPDSLSWLTDDGTTVSHQRAIIEQAIKGKDTFDNFADVFDVENGDRRAMVEKFAAKVGVEPPPLIPQSALFVQRPQFTEEQLSVANIYQEKLAEMAARAGYDPSQVSEYLADDPIRELTLQQAAAYEVQQRYQQLNAYDQNVEAYNTLRQQAQSKADAETQATQDALWAETMGHVDKIDLNETGLKISDKDVNHVAKAMAALEMFNGATAAPVIAKAVGQRLTALLTNARTDAAVAARATKPKSIRGPRTRESAKVMSKPKRFMDTDTDEGTAELEEQMSRVLRDLGAE